MNHLAAGLYRTFTQAPASRERGVRGEHDPSEPWTRFFRSGSFRSKHVSRSPRTPGALFSAGSGSPLARAQADAAQFVGDGRCVEISEQRLKGRRLENRPVPLDVAAQHLPYQRGRFWLLGRRQRWNREMHGGRMWVTVRRDECALRHRKKMDSLLKVAVSNADQSWQ